MFYYKYMCEVDMSNSYPCTYNICMMSSIRFGSLFIYILFIFFKFVDNRYFFQDA